MFKDYQFFSNNLQDAARQILEAQTGEIRGADPDIQRGQHPIYPEGQTDSSYEDAPSEDAPSKEDMDAYKKTMMDSIVKEISRSRPKKETKNTGSKEFNKTENTPAEPASDNTDQQEYPKYRKQS